MNPLTPRRDYNGEWFLYGYQGIGFSTEQDAKAAADFARAYCGEQMQQESRYRRAAERAKEAV
ncbi:MAG TPA: hypothetical protein VEC57_20865 [Candidatus Limnocylindrales bacterium]|nr:hypothetical protein [Candidatus Limnocylindrales bacterium]